MATPSINNTRCTIQLALLSLSSILLVSLINGVQSTNDQLLSTYRVGVYEHEVIMTSGNVTTRQEALEAMRKNIDVYNQTAKTAKSKGVKLLVFPEYGIYGVSMDRTLLNVFAETFPDPKSKHRNPCEDPEFKGQSTEVQRLLSCIAKENSMFLVVNMAGREPCNDESKCPSDREYFYNTNVVFSPNGDVVARYYKTHLFNEDFFNPAKPEAAIFDTPFGKFATFICFDILFKRPAIELVVKHNIRNIAYSAAWVKVFPVFRSIQMHSSFAREANVNLLASNLHRPPYSFGSGIYTPGGAKTYYYRPNVDASKLIVNDIHQLKDVKPDTPIEADFDISKDTSTKNDTKLGEIGTGAQLKFKPLKAKSGSVTVCQKSFCCKAYYAIEGPFEEMYALGIYNGIMDAVGNKMYTQICTLLNCPNSNCGSEITSANTVFSNITLQATGFLSNYVYPSLLTMDGGLYKLVPDDWTYSDEEGLQTRPGKSVTLHSANFVARVYSKDIVVGNGQNSLSKRSIAEFLKYSLYLLVVYVVALF